MPTFSGRDDSLSFGIPAAWRKPSSDVSVQASVNLARGVVESFLNVYDTQGRIPGLGDGKIASLMNAISQLDYKAGTSYYRDTVIQFVNATVSGLDVRTQPNLEHPAEWGKTAVRAYRTYNDTAMLDAAMGIWSQLSPYFVSVDNAARGTHPMRDVPIAQNCNGSTTAGALLWNAVNHQDTSVNVETVGAFSALCGLLFETTQDPQYRVGAELSGEFLKNHFYDGKIILDSLDIRKCAPQNGLKLCYNTGKTLEALSILATGNQSWNPFLSSLVASATAFEGWTRSDGVNTEGEKDPSVFGDAIAQRAFFVRGLYETWERTSDTTMADYIEGYLNVQFNAIRDLASLPGTNQYSSTWTEPPTDSSLDPLGQLNALDLLSSQVTFARRREALAQNGSSTAASASLPSATSTGDSLGMSGTTSVPSATSAGHPLENSKSTHTGAIVGAAVGVAAFIIVISASLWYFLRRRRRARGPLGFPDEEPSLPSQGRCFESPHPAVVPYIETSERPATHGVTRTKGNLEEYGGQSPNDILNSPGFSPGPPVARNDAEGQHRPLLEERRSYDSEMRRRTSVVIDGATSPQLVELLQAIVARLPPESGHQAPPSYYTE